MMTVMTVEAKTWRRGDVNISTPIVASKTTQNVSRKIDTVAASAIFAYLAPASTEYKLTSF